MDRWLHRISNWLLLAFFLGVTGGVAVVAVHPIAGFMVVASGVLVLTSVMVRIEHLASHPLRRVET